MSQSTILNSLTIDARRSLTRQLTHSRFLSAIEIDIFDVEGVDMAWQVTEDGETDVNEEVGAAAGDHKDADGRKEDGDDDD